MITFLDQTLIRRESYMSGRYWIDVFFWVLIEILFFQIISGILVDNFTAMRVKSDVVMEDLENVCFICCINKTELNKLYEKSDKGYSEHIKIDHNYWNYIYLILSLKFKDSKEMNKIEKYIIHKYKKQDFGWIPNKTYNIMFIVI